MLSKRNLAFLLHEWLGVEALCQRPRFAMHSRERFDAVLHQAMRLASTRLAPVNRLLDEQEPRLDDGGVWTPEALQQVLADIHASGLMTAVQDETNGGMQLPTVIDRAIAAQLAGASASAYAYLLPLRSATRLLLRYASVVTAAPYVSQLLQARATCTYCVSEPQAGSSMADIRTRAVRQSDGSFRLYGTKMWIVGGDHRLMDNIVHLVLAKIEYADGRIGMDTDSLSLFLVPRTLACGCGHEEERNDVVATGLSPQMGQRGASSCLLSFGDGYHQPWGQAGAVGWLIGGENQGMALINEVAPHIQLEVGMAAIGVADSGYRHALAYARERHQGRIPGQHSANCAQIPIIEHADIRRMLLLQKSYVEGGMGLGLWCARLVDDIETAPTLAERERAQQLLALLAPVMKCWSAMFGLHANSLAIQVLGCYGYTRDFPVEQSYRDNRLHAIMEGTHGILSMEFLRDQLLAEDARGYGHFLEVVSQTLRRAAERPGDGRHMSVQLGKYTERFGWVLNRLKQERDPTRRLASASLFMEAFGHYVVAWVLLDHWLLAETAYLSAYGNERNFYAGKCLSVRFFFQHELPRIEPDLVLLESMDLTPLEMHPDWF